jgi:hypothetical protein
MKARILSSTILLLVAVTAYCQRIDFGKYQLCYDMYWRCHFQNLIELRQDSTYTFEYRDDTQMMTTKGKWKIEPDFLVLTPDLIPDTIKVTNVFEYINKKNSNNLISFDESFNGIAGLPVDIYRGGIKSSFVTDSIGEIQYNGQVADSISFPIKGRKLKVIPKKTEISTLIRITIDSNYKDLVYQQLGTNKILIHNGRMLVKYRDGENGKLKTEYFERIN